MNKLPNQTITVTTYAEFRELIGKWAERKYGMMVVLGGPGIGKSETVERLMFDTWGKAKEKWGYIKGKITPLRLYRKLYDYRLLPLVFNDVDPLLKDETNVSLLKCVCDTSRYREVQWDSAHAAFDDIPTSFPSISPVLIITNSWEKVSQNIRALHNRGVIIHFRPSVIEVHREVAQGGWFEDREVWEFVGRNLHFVTEPNFRFYDQALKHKRADSDWKELTLRMLRLGDNSETPEQREKLIFVGELLTDRSIDALPAPESERVKRFRERFDVSKATYHRCVLRLKEKRGDFKPEEIASIEWIGLNERKSEYDLVVDKRLAELERQREELLAAGGVRSRDAYDDEDAEDNEE